MTIEDRLGQLEDAHRALAAQHTALLETCKYMLPLIQADPATLRSTLVAIYDSSNNHMQAGYDADFRRDVRLWIDVLSSAISVGHESPPPANAQPLDE